MSTFATVVGLAAAVCTTGANLPQLKKAWSMPTRANLRDPPTKIFHKFFSAPSELTVHRRVGL